MLRSLTAVTSPYFLVMWSSVTPAIIRFSSPPSLGRCKGVLARPRLVRVHLAYHHRPRVMRGTCSWSACYCLAADDARARRGRFRSESGVLRAVPGATRLELRCPTRRAKPQVIDDRGAQQHASGGEESAGGQQQQ